MKLIKEIEVAYFRSIYKEQVTNCSNSNILFGRNDSGKSNILRALNLFFNNETNPDQKFNLERDLNHARRAEAETAADIRKFVYVKVTFTTPKNWRASLGETFWVKRQWSVTTETTPKYISSIRNANKEQYLTRFLNKIKFHYIPAIKDRKIFEKLQAEIYTVISNHAEFSDSLGDFAQALRNRTTDLSQGLLNRLAINSVVSTPQDLSELFRSLDFETTSENGDAYSLTLQRGDGIQVRHIPQILSFLSDRSSIDYHIWGFEEPENSLELASAIDEANTFKSLGLEGNKQIFLTSHSPAFFSLVDKDVERYFVSKTDIRSDRPNSKITPIGHDLATNPGELMGETPHLPVISSYLLEAHKTILRHEREALAFKEEVERSNLPVIFVEGETDKLIFERAWELFIGAETPATFESAGGTSKMESLAKDGKILSQLAPEKRLFCLIDNDLEGRELLASKDLSKGGKWVRHNSNGVYWCRLPLNPDLTSLMRSLKVDEKFWPGCLENIFSPSLRQRAEAEQAYATEEIPHAALFPDTKKIREYIRPREDQKHYFVLAPTADAKVSFAEWVVKLADDEPGILEPLRSTMEGLRDLLAGI
ncbi:AAA family ATPase [Pseudomonas sp. RSB 5.4]|uniref:ATP-dependent nuclease n=1 Tax=Pseudomonas sp. RSB 5.4 TaxID=3127459 RepID=UPI0030D00D7E